MCGRDLARGLDLTPATTCHHIEKLRLAKLLSEHRSGRHVYYSVSDCEPARAVKRSLAALAKEDSPTGGGRARKGGAAKHSKRHVNRRPRAGR